MKKVLCHPKSRALKSKVMGRGASHHRFHAYYDGNVLFFPGKHTND
jgi:hypothetical protein